jgi:hypothetical protein
MCIGYEKDLLPRYPRKETLRIIAHYQLARLIQAKERQVSTTDAKIRFKKKKALHNQTQGERQRDEKVFHGNIARLKDFMAIIINIIVSLQPGQSTSPA